MRGEKKKARNGQKVKSRGEYLQWKSAMCRDQGTSQESRRTGLLFIIEG